MKSRILKYIFLLPGSFWLILFVLFPALLILNTSFLSRNTYGRLIWIYTVDNYFRLLQWEEVKVFLRSFLLAFETTFVCFLLGFPLAYFISRARKKWQSILLLLVIVPFWTSSLVRTYAWLALLQKEGLVNRLLLSFGIISEPIEFLYNEWAVLLGMTYMFLPFMIFPLYAALEKIDSSLIDAAKDLGGGAFTIFRKVLLPLSSGGVLTGSLLVFIPSLGYFFIADLLGGNRTLLISNYINSRFTQARDWPYGATLSVVLVGLTWFFLWVVQKNFRKGKRSL